MASRDRRILLTLAGTCAVLSLVAGLAGVEAAIAYAAPLIGVLVPLVLGRYPGERAFASRVVRHRPLRPRRRLAPVRRPLLVLVPRGTTLMARSLAVRPPPLVAS